MKSARYIGLDVHKESVTMHIIKRNEDGKIEHVYNRRYSFSDFEEMVPRLFFREDYICFEAGTIAPYLKLYLDQYVDNVIVVSPLDFRELYCTSKKTDKVDAKKLATRLKTHIEDNDPDDNFPAVYMPNEKQRELRSLITMYNDYSSRKTQLLNSLKSSFRARGVDYAELKDGSWERNARFTESDRFKIAMYLEDIKAAEERKQEVRAKIERLGVECFEKELRILTSVPGFSVFVATFIMADILTIDRFASPKKLSSYMRTAPRVDASGGKTYMGKVSKRGRKDGFFMMLQSSPHWISSNKDLRDWWWSKRLKSKGKARVAATRKMATYVFYMLKNEETYRFGNAEKHAEKLRQIDKLLEVPLKFQSA